MTEISIKRPVLSTVMTIILLLFGMIGYKFLGVREFPSVDNPIISVNVTYPGSNAEVIMNQITEPLEQNINGREYRSLYAYFGNIRHVASLLQVINRHFHSRPKLHHAGSNHRITYAQPFQYLDLAFRAES